MRHSRHVSWGRNVLDLKKAGIRNTNAVVLQEVSCLYLRYAKAHARMKLAAAPTPSITLDKDTATVADGSTITLVATTVPADAAVSWTSSDDTKASVSDGVVTGEAAGSATITATITVDGVDYTATCAVTVS